MALGQDTKDGKEKCLASNSRKELSLKIFDESSPPDPDTIFLITEVLG